MNRRRRYSKPPMEDATRRELRAAFEPEPLEDGMDHPAEQIIDKALQSTGGQRVLDWFRAFCPDSAHPSFAASVLRCLGRQPHPATAETI